MAYGVAPHSMNSPPIYYNKVIKKLLMNTRHSCDVLWLDCPVQTASELSNET